MSFETGTATNIADLFTKLSTFAVANGWTQNHAASDRLYMTRSTVSVGFVWATASPTAAAVYQHTAFISSGTAVGSHTNDSGQGAAAPANDAAVLAGRHVVLVNSSMRYWFFESDFYIHAVVEVSPGSVNHFGMGIFTKRGTWTGGEYSYGNRNDPAGGTANLATRALSSFLLDGQAGFTSDTTVRPFVGVVHIESLPNQTASGKWGLTWAGTLANTGTDRGGTARETCQGGFRGGPIARAFGRYGGAVSNGLVPMYQIGVWYKDRVQARWYELGHMPDVRGFNIKNFAPADEITVDGDTWVVFPARYKTSVNASAGTRNLGIAYKKVTT